MKHIFHINDIHIGVQRSAGTTLASAFALRQYVIDRLQQMLRSIDGHLIINGDLFDQFTVPWDDFIQTYFILRDWKRDHKDCSLILVPGNHDVSKNANVRSAFSALCTLLSHEPNVVVCDLPLTVGINGLFLHFIPHFPTQAQFDAALKEVPKCDYLFLHCNFDNRFAVQQDHSLNISPEQAKAVDASRIIIAHEHQFKLGLGGKVVIPGNQIPTSISDCLGNAQKRMIKITAAAADGVVAGMLEHVPVWEAKDEFADVDWQSEVFPDKNFIRVSGKAAASEAQAVLQKIAKVRAAMSGYVISNAVEIESPDKSKMAVSLEQIRNFDVMKALMAFLTPGERELVKELLVEGDGVH